MSKPLTDEQKARRAEAAREWRRRNPQRAKEHAARSRAKNRDKVLARQAAWREANRDKAAARSRAWYAENRRRVADRNMRRSFGISLDDYERLLAAQGGRCAICPSTTPGKGERFAVDHDRSCCPGKTSCGACIRGLLCVHCNVGLGHFRDDQDLLSAAIAYLRRDA